MDDTPANPATILGRRLYLAIDCGGTKAAAAITDQGGCLVGRGIGGPANFTDVGLDQFLVSVQEAIRAALSQVTGLKPEACSMYRESNTGPEPLFEAAWFGIAGVDSEADVQQLTPYLASLLSLPHPSPRLLVANDTSLLAAPVRDPSFPSVRTGVVVIAGTGSIVMSFKEEDDGMLRTLGRVGGFGWLLGDEGSGFRVGRDALRFVLDQADREKLGAFPLTLDESNPAKSQSDHSVAAIEGKQSHMLRDRILSLWNLESTDELLNAVYSNRPPGQPRPDQVRSPSLSARNGTDTSGWTTPETPDGYVSADVSSGANTDRVPPAKTSPTSPITPCDVVSMKVPGSNGVAKDGMTEHIFDGSPNLAGEQVQDDKMREGSLESLTKGSKTSTTGISPPVPSAQMLQERKHRLASLAPLVFHLALQHEDRDSLSILRHQARRLAGQIAAVLPRNPESHAFIEPKTSVLCMGGSLLGVHAYQDLLKEELFSLGVEFHRSAFVHDPAKSGSVALAHMWEERIRHRNES